MRSKIDRRHFLKSATALSATLGIGSAVIKSEEREIKPPKNDFVSIFDGKSLDGWHKTGARWKIEDGMIISEQDPPGSGNGGILLSNKTYRDFELLLDVKPGWGCDSGVFLRSLPTGESYQVYVDYHDEPNNGGISGFLYGQQTGGWRTEPFRYNGVFNDEGKLIDLDMKLFTPYLGYNENPDRYACTKEEWRAAWKIDDFNTLRIRCEGKYPIITTWINGVLIGKFDAGATKNPEFDKTKMYETVGDEGHIALQVHGGDSWWADGEQVCWKNIRIKEL